MNTQCGIGIAHEFMYSETLFHTGQLFSKTPFAPKSKKNRFLSCYKFGNQPESMFLKKLSEHQLNSGLENKITQ